MRVSRTAERYVITCSSYNSPPTQVIWEKDGKEIHVENSKMYHFSQTLVNRTTSAYSNDLTIMASAKDAMGKYACSMVNSFGRSTKLSTTITGIHFGRVAVLIHGYLSYCNLIGQFCGSYLNQGWKERLFVSFV